MTISAKIQHSFRAQFHQFRPSFSARPIFRGFGCWFWAGYTILWATYFYRKQLKLRLVTLSDLWPSGQTGGSRSRAPVAVVGATTKKFHWVQFYLVGGGFKHFLFSPPYSGKIPILTHIFQLGWNHQLELCSVVFFNFHPPNLVFTEISQKSTRKRTKNSSPKRDHEI